MVHEMRTYTIKVGKLQEYLHLFEEVGLPIISKYSQSCWLLVHRNWGAKSNRTYLGI